MKTGNKPTPKSPELQHSKGLMRYFQEFDRLTIEEQKNTEISSATTSQLTPGRREPENLPTSLSISNLLPYGTLQRPGRPYGG